MTHEAIYALYPQVVKIFDSTGAFDKDGNKVEIDLAAVNAWQDPSAYKAKRAAPYPSATDYLDGIVKNDHAQIDKYSADCRAVKAKYPKVGTAAVRGAAFANRGGGVARGRSPHN